MLWLKALRPVTVSFVVLYLSPQHLVRNEVRFFDIRVSTAHHRTATGRKKDRHT